MNLLNSKWNITDMFLKSFGLPFMIDFLNLIRHLKPIIAIEWPAHCIYWKFQRVEKLCEKHQLMRFTFDGCMVGIVDKDNNPIKKPWAISTECHELGKAFGGLFCDGSHHHVQGRGTDLKDTEGYSYQTTDMIHSAFLAATKQSRASQPSLCAAIPIAMSYYKIPRG